MALISSNMFPLGRSAPAFELLDTLSDKQVRLAEIRSEIATVIMFICNHCPFVLHVQEQIVQLAQDYQPKGVSFVAINANDVEKYPEDSPIKMKQYAAKYQYSFPYLYDESQAVAKAYNADCTPDFLSF